MKGSYFVLYERVHHHTREVETYEKLKDFDNHASALTFASKNLPSVLAKELPLTKKDKERIKNAVKPYLVTAHFERKYQSSHQGDTDPWPQREVVRCTEADLEKAVLRLHEEEGEEIKVGVELKVLTGEI